MSFSFAQEKTITGTVTSAEDGLPLPGVTVLVKNTTRGQQTDFDGKYSITASAGETLVFTYVGAKKEETVIGADSVIDVALEQDVAALDEVVIVGYGTSTRQAFSGTATTISSENIDAKNFTNVTQALAGEVSGVNVVNTSGQPGTVATVRIRGFGSALGNRDPLYVVDGVPFAGTFNLNAINPADIKSTTILKDATATAIYGSRGANGVVLITTKNGSAAGERSYVQVDVQTGINTQSIPRYDVISNPDEYIGLVWEGLFNRGVVTGNADPVAFANSSLLTNDGIGSGYNMWNVSTGGELINPETRSLRDGVNRLFTPERYIDEAFTPGFRTEANVQIGGGSDKSQYFYSAGYLNDTGYSINTDFTRYSTRLNLKSDVKDWLEVSTNLGYSYSESTNNGQTDGSENIFEFADKMAPIYPVFARFPNSAELIPDPIYGGFQYDYGSPTGDINGFDRTRPNANLLNPIGAAILNFNGSRVHSVNGNVSAVFKLYEGLTFETTFGGQYSQQRFFNVGNNNYGTSANANGNIAITDTQRTSYTFLQLLRYNTSFGDDHSFEILAAHESYTQAFDLSLDQKENVVIPGLYNLSNYSLVTQPSSGYVNESSIESYFAQVNYNYAGKYFLTGSIRTDGSSRFVNDKYGVFGSAGASWVVSEEDFLNDTIFSFLKLKGSYGITGDQQGADTEDGFTIFSTTFVDGSGLAITETRPGDPDLTWETSRMVQGGLELSLGNWLDANFDYYRKRTDNLFFNQRRGPSVGFSSILTNDGEILNSGLEFDLTGHIINKQDFKLDVSINGEFLNNEILTMPLDVTTGLPKIIDSNSSPDSGLFAYAEGRSIFDIYTREYAGVDPSDGAPVWYQYYDDANNNNVLDTGEGTFFVDDGDGRNANGTNSLFEYRRLVPDANIKKTTTKQYANATEVFVDKSFIPDVRGAFRISAKLGSFDISTQFTYSLGGFSYDSQYAELMSDRFGAAGNNYNTDIRNRWQQPGDITSVPLLSDNAIVNGTSASTRFITSTDFLALNNARIGYTIPKRHVDRMGLQSVNLWVSGDNLFINTAREGYNPSIRQDGINGRQIYAPASTYSLGVRVKF